MKAISKALLSTTSQYGRLLNLTYLSIRKLERTMMQILINVPAINKDAYTALGSSSRLVIRLAGVFCFVFSRFTSLLLRENSAASAPEIKKSNTRKTISKTKSNVDPFG